MENIKKNSRLTTVLLIIGGLLIFILLVIGINVSFKQLTKPHVKPRPLPKEAVVSLTKSGFEPTTVTIQKGMAVRWVNRSGTDGSVNSDDYPTNRLYPELNLGRFPNAMSLAHIFTKPGTYTYHNQLHPEQKGTVIVK